MPSKDITFERLHEIIRKVFSRYSHSPDRSLYISTEDLNEICDIPNTRGEKDQGNAYRKRARYVEKLRKLYGLELEYDKAGERYVLENGPSFALSTASAGLDLPVTSETLTLLEILYHLTTNRMQKITSSEKEKKYIEGLKPALEELLKEMRSLFGSGFQKEVSKNFPTVYSALSRPNYAPSGREGYSFLSAGENTLPPPLGRGKSYHLHGYLSGDGERKSYAISSIRDIRIGGREGYQEAPRETSDSPGWRYDVTLSFSPPRAEEIEKRAWPTHVMVEKGKHGDILFKTTAQSLEGLTSFVLFHLPHVEILQPQELKDSVITKLSHLIEEERFLGIGNTFLKYVVATGAFSLADTDSIDWTR